MNDTHIQHRTVRTHNNYTWSLSSSKFFIDTFIRREDILDRRTDMYSDNEKHNIQCQMSASIRAKHTINNLDKLWQR